MAYRATTRSFIVESPLDERYDLVPAARSTNGPAPKNNASFREWSTPWGPTRSVRRRATRWRFPGSRLRVLLRGGVGCVLRPFRLVTFKAAYRWRRERVKPKRSSWPGVRNRYVARASRIVSSVDVTRSTCMRALIGNPQRESLSHGT